MAITTVTIGPEISAEINAYRARMQSEVGKPVTFAYAFRKVMNRAIEILESENGARDESQ